MRKEVTYQGLTFEPYISRDKIDARVKELGKQLTCDYAGKMPLFICVLNGAFPFASDLVRAYDADCEITFIRLKSYQGTSSTGVVKEILGLAEGVEGRDLIIVEDIVDTGRTLKRLIEDLRVKKPASIRTATLLFKPEALETDVHPDYVAFEIPKKFVIGFGLDLDGMARNLDDIYTLKVQKD